MSLLHDLQPAEDEDLLRLRHVIDEVSRSGASRLPPEPVLGDQLGISRGRLRTLLRRVEKDGLIWRHVGKGTFVGPRDLRSDDPGHQVEISVEDVIMARLLLEPRLAAQAAIHSTQSDLTAMSVCLEEMEAADSFLQWKRLDEKLHRAIATATHNDLLLILYDTLRSQVKLSLEKRMEEVFGSERGPKSATHGEHSLIVAAIHDHSPKRAEEAMTRHLASIREILFDIRS